MPRTLPWLTATGNGSRSRKDSQSPTTRNPIKAEKSSSKRDLLRSSPSPPPSSPIDHCASEEFLIEGLENDDKYIMVEDEFYTIAQTFTRHLHYAEYVRRKKEAKAQNAAVIEDLARPTDGVTPMSETLKKKYAAEELAARQEAGLEDVLGKRSREEFEHEEGVDDVEADNSWAGTSLQEFMLSPRKARSLIGAQGIKSSTRAAAGFCQASGNGDLDVTRVTGENGVEEEQELRAPVEETTSDDDDDLDVGPRETSPVTLRRKHRVSLDSRPLQSSPGSVRPAGESAKKGLQPTITGTSSSAVSTTRRRLVFDDDFDEQPALRKSSAQPQRRQSTSNDTRKRMVKEDTASKKSRLNEVPMFLV